jgi:hypothetical protein
MDVGMNHFGNDGLIAELVGGNGFSDFQSIQQGVFEVHGFDLLLCENEWKGCFTAKTQSTQREY